MAVPYDLEKLLDHAELLLNDDAGVNDHSSLSSNAKDAIANMVEVYSPKEFSPSSHYLDACGGCKLKDGGNALYRLLWAFEPTQVDFGYMYKNTLFFVVSKNMSFAIKVSLHKYEPSLYFYTKKKYISGAFHAVQGSSPSSNNGTSCNNPLGQRLFEYIRKFAETQHEVYSGNDFTV